MRKLQDVLRLGRGLSAFGSKSPASDRWSLQNDVWPQSRDFDGPISKRDGQRPGGVSSLPIRLCASKQR